MGGDADGGASPAAPTVRRLWSAAIGPFALAAGFAGLCYSAAGASLGLYLGGVVVASVAAPGVALAERGVWQRAIAVGAVVDGVGTIWLIGAIASNVTIGQWLGCYLLLLAYVAALWGVAELLSALRIEALIAAAVSVTAALAWLTWPIWLSPWLSGSGSARVAAILVGGHPLFAINGALRGSVAIWTEQSVMYQLTNLNQDVPYVLPASVWPAALVHAGLAVVTLGVSGWMGRKCLGYRSGDAPGALEQRLSQR
jgi:hypothetical protein